MNVNNLNFSKNKPISNVEKINEDFRKRSIRYYKRFTKYDIKNLQNYLKKKFKKLSTKKNIENILKPSQNEKLHKKQLCMNDDNNQIIIDLNINLSKLEGKKEFDTNKLKTAINNLIKFYIRKYTNYFYELINKLSITSYLKNINNMAYNNLSNRYINVNNIFKNDKIKEPEENFIKNVYKHKIINNNNKYVFVNFEKKSTLPKYQINKSKINFSILRNSNNNINEKIIQLIQTVKTIIIKSSQIQKKLKNHLNVNNKNLPRVYRILLTPKKRANILSQESTSLSCNKTSNLQNSKPKKVLKITYRNVLLNKNGSITKIIEKNERRVILTDKRNSAINFIMNINKIAYLKSKIKFLNYLKSNKIMDNTYQYVDPIDSENELIYKKIEEFRITLIYCFLKIKNIDIDD